MQADLSADRSSDPAGDPALPRGAQSGKRSSDAYNDPVAQEGARVGQPRYREADPSFHAPGTPLPGDAAPDA